MAVNDADEAEPKSGTMSPDSEASVSTTSLVFERIDERLRAESSRPSRRRTELSDLDDDDPLKSEPTNDDLETGPFLGRQPLPKQMDPRLWRIILVCAGVVVGAWLVGLVVYISGGGQQHPSLQVQDPGVTGSRPHGKKITMGQVGNGFWSPESHSIKWIAGADGEDGLLLEQGASGKDYLVVEDVRAKNPDASKVVTVKSRTLMKSGLFGHDGRSYSAEAVYPSNDLQRVLVATDLQAQWRHSTSGCYWIFDVKTQTAEPLVPGSPRARVQLAQWSPTSDSIVFTRDNNLFLRRVGQDKLTQITKDGGTDVFNGVPDWVYEEEVLAGASATWWSADGNFVAFLRTNETGVPDYEIRYYVSRPSGKKPKPGEESYPESKKIKYPKAGSHNPIVNVKFFDVVKGDVFEMKVDGGFVDEDRLVTNVEWAGKHALVKETNRVSDSMRVVLFDVAARTGKQVRSQDVKSIDGGWFEIYHTSRYIPADPAKGRAANGYIDTVIHDNGNHLAYFTPLDNAQPVMLTSGPWEVDNGAAAVDLERNLVYFSATKESSIQRHIYQVKLTGEDLAPITDTTVDGFFKMSFSKKAGFALLSYEGPGIPWQKVVSTPSNPVKYEHLVEDNKALRNKAEKYMLPTKVYGTVEVDGVALNYVERRPPLFDESKQYPVLFQQYSGPISQTVTKRFEVDFQSFVAAALGYLCVTVDGRGTGFIGRKNRVLVRNRLGQWEAYDQIAAAKAWAAKPYVDARRLAIWGWSYGGYNTLKTLERDAGATFSYGMAVAPVVDWRFYDSVYTERYMSTPQVNPAGYDDAAVHNATALGQNVRFLLMHGVADDNVHFQNTLTLLDRLNGEGVENYDVHVFPDSDHSISFGNANQIVYDKLTNWIVNAFNGQWLKVGKAKPNGKKLW